jgi:hypothetical protein
VILIGLGVIVAYALLVLGHPLVTCPACFGHRVHRPRRGRGRRGRLRVRKCWLCHAKGLVRMPFATTVHRYFWSIAGERMQDKRRAENAERLNARKGQAE